MGSLKTPGLGIPGEHVGQIGELNFCCLLFFCCATWFISRLQVLRILIHHMSFKPKTKECLKCQRCHKSTKAFLSTTKTTGVYCLIVLHSRYRWHLDHEGIHLLSQPLFGSLGTGVPKFVILMPYSSIHSFRFISFSFREKFRSLSLYVPLNSIHVTVLLVHFNSFHIPSWLYLFVWIVWVFELFAGGPFGCTLVGPCLVQRCLLLS